MVASVVLVLFTALQVADGLLTFSLVKQDGIGAELNPLMAHLFNIYGAGTTLFVSKSLSIVFGALLFLHKDKSYCFKSLLGLTLIMAVVLFMHYFPEWYVWYWRLRTLMS